uniref:Uncharacterized protein n=1 Tax=Oryza meridionalis TaxID=40149 RepID=A0A0E0F3Q4_9ORYZ
MSSIAPRHATTTAAAGQGRYVGRGCNATPPTPQAVNPIDEVSGTMTMSKNVCLSNVIGVTMVAKLRANNYFMFVTSRGR